MKILYKHCAGKLGEKEKGFGKDLTEKDKATVPTGRKTGKKTERDQQYHDILRGNVKEYRFLGDIKTKRNQSNAERKAGGVKMEQTVQKKVRVG